MEIEIHPKVHDLIQSFDLPTQLTFGETLLPVMIESHYDDHGWSAPRLIPYKTIELDPTCKVLHYGQEIFEGLKAYAVEEKGPFLFRPDLNQKRFNLSAKRMAIPDFPQEYFIKSMEALTRSCQQFIPKGRGESLYLRPFIFATENHLGIKCSKTFQFLLIGSPSGSYFSGDEISVYVEKDLTRATPGGVGLAKTGGNYAACLMSMEKATALGAQQVLWANAHGKQWVEELSGMNFFACIDGELVTPEAGDTILDGVTRKSLLELAEHLGITTRQRPIAFDELMEGIQSGSVTEAFACGTAVIVIPIKSFIFSDGRQISFSKSSQRSLWSRLRTHLLDIQEGTGPDPFGWRHPVSKVTS